MTSTPQTMVRRTAHPRDDRRPARTGPRAAARLPATLAAGLLALAGSTTGAEPLPITVRELGSLETYPVHSAPATVVSLNRSRIAAEATGRLIELPVRVGDQLGRGQLLARLDCQDYALEVERVRHAMAALEAERRLAAFQQERAERLYRDKNIAEDLLNQRESRTQVLSARIAEQGVALRKARRDVDKCELHAPFPAWVTARLAGVGEWLERGHAVVEVMDLANIEVSAQVPTREAATLARATDLAFVDRERRFPLRLRAVLPILETRTRTREARLGFLAGQVCPPGTAGRLSWHQDRPHLPAEYLTRRGGRLGVLVVRAGLARFHPLPEALEGRPAPVDLDPHEQVIVEGRHAARDGDPIQVR